MEEQNPETARSPDSEFVDGLKHEDEIDGKIVDGDGAKLGKRILGSFGSSNWNYPKKYWKIY